MAKIKPLRQCEIFANLSDKELALFSRIVSEVDYEPGTVLVAEKMKSEKLYLIENGKVSVTAETGSGDDELILGEGESLGEWSLIAPSHLTCATVTVVEKADVLVLVRDDFLEFMEKEPAIAIKIVQGIIGSIWPDIDGAREFLQSQL